MESRQQVKLTKGKSPHADVIWTIDGMLATTSGENLVRYHLAKTAKLRIFTISRYVYKYTVIIATNFPQ